MNPDRYPRKHVDTGFVDEGRARLAQRAPSLRHAPVLGAWSQLDSYSADGKPVIGPVDEFDGLFLNVAGSGKGHKIAPAAGQFLASLITGSTAHVNALKPFFPARFASGGFVEGEFAYARRTIG
jgi:glycine/D-amino acid oxidase-like deaminating enzyme